MVFQVPVYVSAYLSRIALAVMVIVGVTVGGWAADLNERDVAGIREVIERQIDAFKNDDAETAYSFAAPEIKAEFPTPDIFMAMVRKQYQSVYRPRRYSFSGASMIEGQAVQPLRVVGPDGSPVIAVYMLERQPDGTWKIASCVIVRAPGKAILPI